MALAPGIRFGSIDPVNFFALQSGVGANAPAT